MVMLLAFGLAVCGGCYSYLRRIKAAIVVIGPLSCYNLDHKDVH